MAENDETRIPEAVLRELQEIKEVNRKLLRENTDLKIQNAKLTRRLEWHEAFGKRRTYV